MKTLGLIGGTSWVSTVDYYRYINKMANDRCGGLNYAPLIIDSLNFHDVSELAFAKNWSALGELMIKSAVRLEKAGAEGIVLCANTTHIVADEVEAAIAVPVIRITDAVARAINDQGLKKIALLGTNFTMEQPFYAARLGRFGIETLIPEVAERAFIHESIYEELGKDIFTESTKHRYLEIIDAMIARGAEGVILGCTEIPMLLKPGDISTPSFDTTMIHSRAAVEFALA
jgi:aspartate racemase